MPAPLNTKTAINYTLDLNQENQTAFVECMDGFEFTDTPPATLPPGSQGLELTRHRMFECKNQGILGGGWEPDIPTQDQCWSKIKTKHYEMSLILWSLQGINCTDNSPPGITPGGPFQVTYNGASVDNTSLPYEAVLK